MNVLKEFLKYMGALCLNKEKLSNIPRYMSLLKNWLVFTIASTTLCYSQANTHTDSLFATKNYLQAITSTINQVKDPKQRVGKLDSLIRLGTEQKAIFERNMKVLLKENDQEYKMVSRSFNFILQSVILYKTDMKENNYRSNQSTKTELVYLNKNIPPLIDKIYRYCSVAQKRH
ncbi:hypothetical protein MUY27_11860 [Mucilaginibacter sp. RS28]|uniref:Uncharacterized protein n=1 Tax=Mucilaginibacter straminoryzae TaxID=2932774 RepID=A0A9X2B9F7_9SPHI|nr:hypothetical protein [Mucilaginibacter straminoryzae]MCJ8210406.1 hypothetical protein [Mucilaginibacter straminoryzae]